VTSHLTYEPLALDHTDDLAALLLNEQVYRHIGGEPPSVDRFRIGMAKAIAGPPEHRAGEKWINYAVRHTQSGQLLGRLEATIHESIAEVAFLFGPAHWGKGFATEGLLWLHQVLLAHPSKPSLWATAAPPNRECRALLERCGYRPIAPEVAPRLLTYDPGDLVYRGPSAA